MDEKARLLSLIEFHVRKGNTNISQYLKTKLRNLDSSTNFKTTEEYLNFKRK